MNSIQNHNSGSRAVVIGGSIAGLLAARVLSEHVDEVVILEKDDLPDKPAPRRGTPHSAQLHSIHQRGVEIINELFPDLTLDFDSCGMLPSDLGADMRWFFFGEWMPRIHAGVSVSWCERPRFEWTLRERVAARPNVVLMGGCKVTALLADESKSRLTGVVVQMADGQSAEQELAADLVVDAGARGSRVPQWLAQLGYPKAPESVVKIGFGDATRTYQLPDQLAPSWKALLVSAKPGLSQKLGLIHMLPNNQCKVLLAGWFGDHPPADDAGFLAFARSLPQPDIYDYLHQATPLSPIYTHKLPSNLWRHYEKMTRWPNGLFVMGDAVCSFNPSFGQGITVAALHAVTLQDLLRDLVRRGHDRTQPGVARQFQKSAARIVQNPWMITTGEDLRFPQSEGPRPWLLPLIQGYLAQVFDAAHRDPRVAKRFMEVMTFVEGPPALFRPDILLALARQAMSKMIPKPAIRPDADQHSAGTCVRTHRIQIFDKNFN